MNTLNEIVGNFAIDGKVISVEPLGNGLINDTYKVVTDKKNYVLQRINNAIFKDVDLLQHNIEAVTDHIRKKLTEKGENDVERKALKFIHLKEDSSKTYAHIDDKFWRVSEFIEGAKTFETVNPEYSYYAGKAFGNFEAMLSDIDEKLGETIPDFHNMELRVRQLREAVKNDAVGRMKEKEVRDILSEIEKYADEMCLAEKLHREGKLPKRICHCDTKVNNMMFDDKGNILCVIDLDTVMPSFVFSDYGDFLRTAANTLPEDAPETEKVDFRMDIFQSFTKGYLEGTKSFLTDLERDNLPYAACLFPFMQAVRFFADYINGDTYYKIKYPEHNLVRTRNQMKLFNCAMAKKDEMKSFIESCK